MWLISWLPQWVYYLGLIGGFGAVIANLRGLHIAGALLIAGSCWHLGGVSIEQQWQARAKEMQAKVALAEQKSVLANNQVVTQVVTKTKLIKEKTQANVEYITHYVAQDLDSDCKLTPASIMLHNSASQGQVPTSTTSAAGTATPVKASELITTVVENYGTYYEVVERLRAWQDWYYAQKKIFVFNDGVSHV
jgi:hypothetical protein